MLIGSRPTPHKTGFSFGMQATANPPETNHSKNLTTEEIKLVDPWLTPSGKQKGIKQYFGRNILIIRYDKEAEEPPGYLIQLKNQAKPLMFLFSLKGELILAKDFHRGPDPEWTLESYPDITDLPTALKELRTSLELEKTNQQ